MVQPLSLTAVGKLDYRTEWVPEEEGTYQLSAVVKDGTRKYKDSRSFEVRGSDLELENPYPDMFE